MRAIICSQADLNLLRYGTAHQQLFKYCATVGSYTGKRSFITVLARIMSKITTIT